MTSGEGDWPARVEQWRDLATLTLVLAGALAIPLVFLRDPSVMFALPLRSLATRVRAGLVGCECVSRSDVRIPFTLGAAYNASSDPRSAVAQYERALLIDLRPEIYLSLALAQLE